MVTDIWSDEPKPSSGKELCLQFPTERTDYTEAYGIKVLEYTERIDAAHHTTEGTLSLQKKAIRLNNQGKTMIAKDSFVPLL